MCALSICTEYAGRSGSASIDSDPDPAAAELRVKVQLATRMRRAGGQGHGATGKAAASTTGTAEDAGTTDAAATAAAACEWTPSAAAPEARCRLILRLIACNSRCTMQLISEGSRNTNTRFARSKQSETRARFRAEVKSEWNRSTRSDRPGAVQGSATESETRAQQGAMPQLTRLCCFLLLTCFPHILHSLLIDARQRLDADARACTSSHGSQRHARVATTDVQCDGRGSHAAHTEHLGDDGLSTAAREGQRGTVVRGTAQQLSRSSSLAEFAFVLHAASAGTESEVPQLPRPSLIPVPAWLRVCELHARPRG